ncbi:hypothetical protein Q4I28_000764 [Leishmania naiffi]|uniref:Uncharacterized protein n=1 Tax=Leishmania naiffi TaxID=5678 RepID=A0AAW3C863_9TRYP
MTSTADGVEEAASVLLDVPALASSPLSPSPPPLVSSADAEPQLLKSPPSASCDRQQDAPLPLPLPLPASPMTRRCRRPFSSASASAHYLTTTTAAIARSRSPRNSAAVRSAAPSPSTSLAPPRRQCPQRSRTATTAESRTTSSPPTSVLSLPPPAPSSPPLGRASVPPLRSTAAPSAGDRGTSAARPQSSQQPQRQQRSTQPGTAPRRATAVRGTSSAVSPYRSLIDAVLDEQFALEPGSPPSQQQQQAAAAGVVVDGADTILAEVIPSKRRKYGGGVAVRQHRAQHLAGLGQTEGGLVDADDSEDDGKIADSTLAPLHQQALRLQPLPPAASASTLIEAAALLGSDGGEQAETLADVIAVAPTQSAMQSAVQSALATERARLLCNSPCMGLTQGAAGGVTGLEAAEARERLWRPTTEPRVAARAFRHTGVRGAATDRHTGAASTRVPNSMRATAPPPALPTAFAEFLKVEADAEAAVQGREATATCATERQRHASSPHHTHNVASPRAGASSMSAPTTTLPTSFTLAASLPVMSPAAESAAVLQELKAVQRRLREHGHRLETAAAATGATPPEAEVEARPPAAAPPKGIQGLESCSPCDISTNASSASSTATNNSSTPTEHNKRHDSARRTRVVGLRRASSEYWVTASLTEIVDALDGQCTATLARERRTHQQKRSQANFDPASYARRLLDTTARSSSSLTASDDDDGEYDTTGCHSRGVQEGRCGDGRERASENSRCDRLSSAPCALGGLSPASLKREALLRSGPAWATAAAELGLTPTEVQDLLRYSLSSTDAAAAWLASARLHTHNVKGAAEAAVDTQGNDDVGRARTGRGKKRSSSNGEVGGPPSVAQTHRPHRLASASLDVAAQTALVQRIVAAMPAIPTELQAELSRQRRLLERVCRDVSCMSASAHAAVRARLASPTVSSAAARQPSSVEFSTGVRGGEGLQTILPTAAEAHKVQAQHEEHQQLLYAPLPRPAAQALITASGLRGAAADPSRPLPPFHAVVARPTRHTTPVTPASPMGNGASTPQEPYETALRELAERETRHYVSELDRLRAMYDRQLQEERRQRQQERRQYAELLQSQQQKMLRHHRETVHLLQRESRLQQQQQESLVQKLAASQAAAAQRQQTQHEQATKHMLAGAVDVMKSYVTAEGVGGGKQVEMGPPAGVTVAPGVMQKRRRQQQRKRPDGSLTPSLAAAHGPDESDNSGTGRKCTAAAVAVTAGTPPHPSAHGPIADAASRTSPLRRPASETNLAPSSVSSPAMSPSRGMHGSPAEQNYEEGAVTPTATGKREERHHTPDITLSVAPSVSALVPTPAASTQAGVAVAGAGPPTNTPEMLRAVYGGDAGPPPRRPRTQGRMTLPLHVQLPPEEDTTTRQRLGKAALMAELSDLCAMAAARDAGFAEGTRLYGVQPRRPRLSQSAPSPNTGEAAVERLNQAAPRRALSASPSSAAVKRRARAPDSGKVARRRRAESRWSGSGRSRGGRAVGSGFKNPGPSTGRRWRGTSPYATTGNSSDGVAHRSNLPLPHRFDTEVVSLLCSEAGTAPSHVVASSTAYAVPVAPHDVVTRPAQYSGMRSEAICVGDRHAHGARASDQETADAVVVAAGVTAGRSSIGQPLLVLTQPVGGAVPTYGSCTPQEVDAQLRAALHHRASLVRDLRHKKSPCTSPPRSAPPQAEAAATLVHDVGSTGDDDDGHTAANVAGSLPPCDGVFFGASAEVLINTTDSCAIGDDSDGALPSSLDVAPVPLVMLTDYARAWALYTAAEREVEGHAQALAAEDAGVLEAVSRAPEHRRRSQGEEDDAASTLVARLPRPASTAAAVCYREKELGYGGPSLQGASMYVSPRMAAEAQALREARRRLSDIRACFIAPPSLGAAGVLGNVSAGRVTGVDAALRDAALVRQLVDATVLSVLETQHQQSQPDLVRQVMAAMEHEILRLMLAGCLEEEVERASGAAMKVKAPEQREKAQQQPQLDAEFARALAEATLEDAVHAALERSRRGKKACQAATSPDAPAARMDAPAAAEVEFRESVRIPRTAPTAWLRDVDSPPPQPQEPPQPRDVRNAQSEADTITATATVVLPPPRGDNHAATCFAALRAAEPTPQEVRIVVDLSPVVHHMGTLRDRAAAMPVYDSQQQQQYCPQPYPPVQQEQLPSRWMALEDRRDVIVEVETHLAVAEVKAEVVDEHTRVAAPTSDYGGLPAPVVSTTLPTVPPPPPLPVVPVADLTSAHVHGTTALADHTASRDPPQLMLLRLLQSALLDQERLQRTNLADREEEQRQAHKLLCEVAKAAAERRMFAVPPSPSVAAISTVQSQPALPQQLVTNAAPDKARHEDGEAAETAMSRVSAPSSQKPPPVRDPVMEFVLERMRQFGASQGQRLSMCGTGTGISSASLVEDLTVAAQTAGLHYAAPPAGTAVHRPLPDPFVRYAASRPSTRNLGSSTTTVSSCSSLSSSLPTSSSPSSSLPTSSSSSSSSSLLTDQALGRARITGDWYSRAQHTCVPRRISSGAPVETSMAYLRPPTRKARPVLDMQRDDASASTATTHYTTGRNSVVFPSAEKFQEDRAVPTGSSCLLPPRASAEVQAALTAALHAHQQAKRADVSTATLTAGYHVEVNDIPLGSPVGNHPYAVSPPVSTAAAVQRSSPAKLRAPPPTWSAMTQERGDARGSSSSEAKGAVDDVWKPTPSVATRENVVGPIAVVGHRGAREQRATKPQPTSPPRTAAWACTSLTSTSTSSHSGNGGDPGSGREPNRAYSAQDTTFTSPAIDGDAPASSALPFLSARTRHTTEPARRNSVPPASMPTSQPLPVTAAAAPLPSSPSSLHEHDQLLQAAVLRAQQEQRATEVWRQS